MATLTAGRCWLGILVQKTAELHCLLTHVAVWGYNASPRHQTAGNQHCSWGEITLKNPSTMLPQYACPVGSLTGQAGFRQDAEGGDRLWHLTLNIYAHFIIILLLCCSW
jgi:hypothetical protein